MSVERVDVIDGVGIRPDGLVEMLISDHLEWQDELHLQLLASKVEAYANVALSGQLVQVYPAAEGKQVCIRLVWQRVPNVGAENFFEAVREQLRSVGIEFTHGALPDRY